jgi:serine/threonine-protein kinase
MTDTFDLTPAQWATLRQLLDEALERPPGQRAAWLATLAPPYAPYRERLQALLGHAEGATAMALIQTLPKIETAAFAPMPGRDGPAGDAPERVGPYRLLRELGSGGMASVWLAERTDMLQRRQVALKLPHGAWRRAGLAERLQREREILATLEHPNIARLYDAGLADDGQPYLALEYVQGERIDLHCQHAGLGVPGRLQLFLQVARAVAHAHAQGAVHRDLKPSNILVTGAGDVKLLDFGIAKLLDPAQPGAAAPSELTRLAGPALTPEYAAPEQLAGAPVGTAADVYALGVLLYELPRRGVLVEDTGQTYLAEPDADGDEARTLRPLQAAALARHKQSPGLFVSGLGLPHCLRAPRRPQGADLARRDAARDHSATAAVRRHRRVQPARRGSGGSP